MTGSAPVRLTRIVIVMMLFAAVAITPSLAAPVPLAQPSAASQQGAGDSEVVPGLGDLPEEATLVSSASSELDEPVDAPATLTVERLSVEPGESLDPVEGPQIIQVEQGLLTFEDDLGLEAEIAAGSAQFFDAGDGDAITNTGEEPAIIVRTSVTGGAPADDEEADATEEATEEPTEEPTEDDAADDEENDQGGEDGETRDRDRDREEDEDQGESAGINALFAQSDAAPDEVVLTLTEDGFEPDGFEIVQGGELVIENATEEACTFAIPDLLIEAEIGAGDIESVTVDGSAGTHEFTCTNEDGDVVADGSFFLARPATTPEPEETETPVATPDADETGNATPEPEETETATATEPAGETPMGVLIEATLETVPEDAQSLFAAQIVLDPDGALSLAGAGGAIGLAVSGGDLTVSRPGHSPARLRDGRSVLLPDGIIATLSNNGDAPINLQVAGLIGAGEPEEAPTEEPEDNGGNGGDDGPADMTGANQFIPSDAEMEQLGLFVLGRGPEELTDPADNAIWFEDADQAEELLPTFDWESTVINLYDSDSEETDYGTVELFVINVDVFADDGSASDFYAYVDEEIFAGQSRSSDVAAELEGVDQEMYVSFFNSETEFDVGFMVIQSGEYVITLYTQGSDLDATTIMEDVASLIFGPRG